MTARGLPARTVQTLRALNTGRDAAADVAAYSGASITATYGRLRAAWLAGYASRRAGRYTLTPAGRAALRTHEDALGRRFRQRRGL